MLAAEVAAAAAEKERAARVAEAARVEAEMREKENAEREMAAAVESQRRLLEQQREVEVAAAAAEAAREAEAERLASIQRANEAVLAAAAISAKESAELEAARKKAEEVRRKREMFLSDVSDFSTTFEAQSVEADEAKRRLAETEAETLQQGMRGLSGAYVAPEARVAEAAAPSSSSASSSASSSVEPVGPAFVVTTTSAAAEAPAPQDDGKNKQALASLSSSLFATSGVAASAGQAGAATAVETETFRMPTRIGLRGPAITPSQIPAPSSAVADDDDEEEGEGGDESISNVLTRDERRNLTATERAYWRALQADLTTRRREFHGAVTYAFDGIFSWQMYGSAEAVDETGSAYTEYLMRCQWGTTWDNMQPWISARRYREFDSLDHDLKRAFPAMEHSMPRLPAKDFFRFLEQDVIEKRRSALENYMTRIVAHLPTILRSDQVSDFLGIKERIATIRPLLARIESSGSGSSSNNGGSTVTARRESELLRDRGSSASSSSPSSSPHPPLPPAEGRVDLDRSGLVLSVDAAEAAKVAANARFFIDSELSVLEEQVRDLTLLLRSATPQQLLFKNQRAYYLLSAIATDWPRLRATTGPSLSSLFPYFARRNFARLTHTSLSLPPPFSPFPCAADMASQHADMDFTLIPRAMQIEEDLVRSIGDFRSLLAAHSLGTD